MRYALNLAEDGRILYATYEKYAPAGAVLSDELPEGDITDYRCIDGGFVYDPLPGAESDSAPTLEDRVITLENDSSDMKEALEMILLGVIQ